jgi:hypothetical protein
LQNNFHSCRNNVALLRTATHTLKIWKDPFRDISLR